nr:unnamed protein product [Callosobruchus chinensis]
MCFYIVDRIKEMLKYKSWHVAPAMIEQILMTHPAVSSSVVIGIPHETDGDHPLAVIVLNEGYMDVAEDDFIDYVAAKAPDRMKLRGGVKFLKQLPITPSGKVKRKELRDMVLNGEL